ncbi:methylated-DNA--[protein]-cysteine S-methyltransferase [Patescibacteria group bacterium]|nr:MAG: methylated-DNA--[protein]-cysteine S-methyltransferase [Patescibacteria group bacterium]
MPKPTPSLNKLRQSAPICLSNFALTVLAKTALIPAGRVTTYGELAAAAGRAGAARAVGNILHKNPFAPAVPCHRVVGAGGRVGGFATGARRKRLLLRREGVHCRADWVDLDRYGYRFNALTR